MVDGQPVNFLIDTGSSETLVSDAVIKCPTKDMNFSTKQFHCFKGRVKVQCWQHTASFTTPSGEISGENITVVPGLSIGFFVPGVFQHSQRCSLSGQLSPNFLKCINKQDRFTVHGILGVDLLPSLLPFEVLGGEASESYLRISDGYIPFGILNSRGPTKPLHKISLHIRPSDCLRENDRGPVGRAEVPTQRPYGAHKPKPSHVSAALSFVIAPQEQIEATFEDDLLERSMSTYLHLDNFDHSPSNATQISKSEVVQTFMKNNISFNKHLGKYQVRISWDHDMLKRVPHNYSVCKIVAQRVYQSTCKKGISADYLKIFQDQMDLNIIEPLPRRFDVNDFKFITHRPIVKKDPLVVTTKIRAVFNCSLRIGKAPSVNDCVAFPPDLLADLLDLFFLFRSNNYFAVADIEKAFLNIKLEREADRNCFAFVVFNGQHYAHYRFTSVLFGFVQSPYFLNCVLKYIAAQTQDSLNSHLISQNFYVDNFINTSNSIEHLQKTSQTVSSQLREGGFQLREWISNSPDIVQSLPSASLGDSTIPFKILGYSADPSQDTITIRNLSLDSSANTKRTILSSVNSIFDPAGFLAPVTASCKLILRQISDAQVGWDDVLPQSILESWAKLCKQFKSLDTFSVPRRAFDCEGKMDINIFTDASQCLLGYSFYVVQNSSSNLLFSKNKLTPKPAKSIPTLELLAIHLALNALDKTINMEHFPSANIAQVKLFSDSQVALSWILNRVGPKRNLYACNRIKEIHVLLDQLRAKNIHVDLNFVTTEDNPADLLTRPIAPSKLSNQLTFYLEGPRWVSTGDQPPSHLLSVPTKFVSPDKRIVYQTAVEADQPQGDKSPLIDLSRFGSYDKAVNSLATALKFIDLLRRKTLSNLEYKQKALELLVRFDQQAFFSAEIDYLKNPTGSAPKLVTKLRLYIDEKSILRSKGRMTRANLSPNVIHPVLLNGSSELARLIIHFAHNNSMHLGVNSTLNYIRSAGFWLTSARVSVSKQLREGCMRCKRFNLPPFKTPSEADLPFDRTNFTSPFHATGMDYCGPFSVTNSSGKNVPIYVLLFTCMASRAIHLEATPDLTTVHFLNAFIRFTNRYSVPKVLYSDNQSTFKQGTNLLKTIVNTDPVQSKFVTLNITVRNTPAYSPSQGGAWERMVGLTKTCFAKTFGAHTYPLFTFLTILTDCQQTLNNRPLTYIASDGDFEIITPNSLISMHSTFPCLMLDQENFLEVWRASTSSEGLRNVAQALEERKTVHNNFVSRWYINYLLALRDLPSKLGYDATQKWLEPGSICILTTPGSKRHNCPLVRILDLLPDKKGVVRNVRIVRPTGAKSVVAASLLVPLELSLDVSAAEVDSNPVDSAVDSSPTLTKESLQSTDSGSSALVDPSIPDEPGPSTSRPTRMAADRQRRMLRDMVMGGRL